MKLRNILIGLLLVGFLTPVSAAPPMGGAGWKGSLGLGVLWKDEPYKGGDDTVLPIPLINLKYQRLYIQGFTVGYKLIDELEGSIDMIVQPRLEGYDAGDSAYFEGMEDRDYSIDVGLALNAQFGRVLLNVSVVSDVLGYSDGQEVSASVGYNFVFGGTGQSVLRVTPTLGLKWLSANLVDYYYGVRAGEARADRSQYTGDAGFNGTAGVIANYFFTTHSGISAGVQYEAFGNEVADSPLLEKDYSLRVFAGYSWMF